MLQPCPSHIELIIEGPRCPVVTTEYRHVELLAEEEPSITQKLPRGRTFTAAPQPELKLRRGKGNPVRSLGCNLQQQLGRTVFHSFG
jgi:hypothetical protein